MQTDLEILISFGLVITTSTLYSDDEHVSVSANRNREELYLDFESFIFDESCRDCRWRGAHRSLVLTADDELELSIGITAAHFLHPVNQ